MNFPKVSVVIPAYNQAQFIGETIQSVLNQSYPHFEVIIVNDASPDHTTEVVRQFTDPRIKYVVHEQNRGLPATRNTGMRASSGELIALLDGDDLFHPDKLQAHVNYYLDHPEIGATYNNRFNLNYSLNSIRELHQAPPVVGLQDFILGFPFAPSDMVIRREWAFQVNFFNEKHRYGAEDIDFPCRLALDGCKFGRVDRALNYRRYHSGRTWKIRLRIEDALLALENIFHDPRCPPQVLTSREVAIKNHYEVLTYPAFMQGETELGQELLREAVCLVPDILEGDPCPYVEMLARMSSADIRLNHEIVLKNIFLQLPDELKRLTKQLDWAISRGYLIKGVCSVMWGRVNDGKVNFTQAVKNQASLDMVFLNHIANQILAYANEFGYPSADKVLEDLVPYIEQVGKRSSTRRLIGNYSINRAFRAYHADDYPQVIPDIFRAIVSYPNYMFNRGVLAMLYHSAVVRIKIPLNGENR